MLSKKVIFVSLVSLRSQNCRDLRDFLGVKFSSRVLLRVKELTFCNSVYSIPAMQKCPSNFFAVNKMLMSPPPRDIPFVNFKFAPQLVTILIKACVMKLPT